MVYLDDALSTVSIDSLVIYPINQTIELKENELVVKLLFESLSSCSDCVGHPVTFAVFFYCFRSLTFTKSFAKSLSISFKS